MENNRPQTSPVMERENIMGTMEINPLLVKLSVPMMISMLVQALYNVVDSVFVSWVSEEALTAVSLAFSLQNMMIAVGVGTGVGVNAMLSKSLGEKNQKRANATAENGIFLLPASSLTSTPRPVTTPLPSRASGICRFAASSAWACLPRPWAKSCWPPPGAPS